MAVLLHHHPHVAYNPRAPTALQEEEAIGDVDLFTLTESGDALTVNAKWLQHLEERLLGEDGHPRKAVGDEDPHRMGLVLEWVFGTIVSTAEKARDCAKRGLGTWCCGSCVVSVFCFVVLMLSVCATMCIWCLSQCINGDFEIACGYKHNGCVSSVCPVWYPSACQTGGVALVIAKPYAMIVATCSFHRVSCAHCGDGTGAVYTGPARPKQLGDAGQAGQRASDRHVAQPQGRCGARKAV